MNSHTNLYETSVYHFCRLTGLPRQEYDLLIFESGYQYAERYSQKITSIGWKELSKEMLQLPIFWSWWKELWNLRILESFKLSGINENTLTITKTDALFLLHAFYTNQNPHSFLYIKPNLMLLKTLKEKIHENEKLCKILSLPHKGITGKRSDTKNKSAKQGDLRKEKHNDPMV